MSTSLDLLQIHFGESEAGGGRVNMFTIYINTKFRRIFYKNNIDDQIIKQEKKKPDNYKPKWIFPPERARFKKIHLLILQSFYPCIHPSISMPIYLNIYHTKIWKGYFVLSIDSRWIAKHPPTLRRNRSMKEYIYIHMLLHLGMHYAFK